MTARTSSSSERRPAKRWQSRFLRPKHGWSGTFGSEWRTIFSCRTFR